MCADDEEMQAGIERQEKTTHVYMNDEKSRWMGIL